MENNLPSFDKPIESNSEEHSTQETNTPKKTNFKKYLALLQYLACFIFVRAALFIGMAFFYSLFPINNKGLLYSTFIFDPYSTPLSSLETKESSNNHQKSDTIKEHKDFVESDLLKKSTPEIILSHKSSDQKTIPDTHDSLKDFASKTEKKIIENHTNFVESHLKKNEHETISDHENSDPKTRTDTQNSLEYSADQEDKSSGEKFQGEEISPLTDAKEQITKLEKRINHLENKVLLTATVFALKETIYDGRPFAIELKILEKIFPDEASLLNHLSPYAETGIISLDRIEKKFSLVAQNMRQAAVQQKIHKNTGYLDKMLDQALTFLKIRYIETPPKDVEDKISYIEKSIENHNLKKAITEYETLPESSQKAGEGLFRNIVARIEALECADQLITQTIKTSIE